jgi:hypothetical protein
MLRAESSNFEASVWCEAAPSTTVGSAAMPAARPLPRQTSAL